MILNVEYKLLFMLDSLNQLNADFDINIYIQWTKTIQSIDFNYYDLSMSL